MTEQNTRATLYKKIAAVAGAIEAVEKDSRNKDQGYRYASPAGVMSAVKPLMAAQGIAIVPHLVEFVTEDTGQKSQRGAAFVLNRVMMHYHIIDGESGEEMVVPWQGQSGTYGDDKGLAKAQTIALRTFLIQLFQIPAEDPETDPDAKDARPASYTPRQPAVSTQEARDEQEFARRLQQKKGTPAPATNGDTVVPICPEHNRQMRPGKDGASFFCPIKHDGQWYSVKAEPAADLSDERNEIDKAAEAHHG